MNGDTEATIRSEAVLGIASALLLIGSFSPWETIGPVSSNALGSWHGDIAFVGALLTIFATTVSYGIYRLDFLQRFRPYTDGVVGLIGSLLALLGGFSFFASMSPGASSTWGLYLTLIAGFLGLFSSYQVYRSGVPSLPKGLSGKGLSA